MTNHDITNDRLYNQQLSSSKFKRPEEIVKYMCAMQAQDYKGAKWSVGLRVSGITDHDIEKVIAEKKIVRTWSQRGTLHFINSEDLRWIISLTSERCINSSKRRYKELELDDKTLFISNDIFAKALSQNDELSRTDLLNLVEQNGISTAGQRSAFMLQRASLDGIMCQIRTEKNVPYYVAVDGSIPDLVKFSREEALAEFALRYFVSRNPATLQDFVWWSGLKVTDARIGLEAIKHRFTKEVFFDNEYWIDSNSELNKTDMQNEVYLLPGFDEYLIAYKDRSASLNKKYMSRINSGGGMLSPTIVINGSVVGTWQRKFVKEKAEIHVQPFSEFTETELQAILFTAQQFGQFIEIDIAIL